MSKPPEPVRLTFACANALLAIALLFGVFGALPVRYWPVDAASSLLAIVLLISAYGVLRRSAWHLRALRVSAVCELSLGLTAIAALVLGVVYLGGVHGGVGRTALTVALAGSAFLVPYLVIYPVLQLIWIHHTQQSTRHV
jgi:hypothetical protein